MFKKGRFRMGDRTQRGGGVVFVSKWRDHRDRYQWDRRLKLKLKPKKWQAV